ncbi:hypothetical protein [Arenimonas sp. MALMAid1274]|uniref:hypothetical protein n=1 Tax=Arenimonas sp. MALMAid1274 TaxID=3411630 RepID=UPI003BA315EA
MVRILVVAMMWLAVQGPVAAAEGDYVPLEQRLSPEQQRATGLDTLSPAQLALLNRLLREDAAQVVEAVRAQAQAEAAPKSDPSRYIGLGDEPIRSQVQGRVTGWKPGDEFRLANGQVWKVLKGKLTLDAPRESPEIVVVPGIAGRWFLQVDEDLPKARVYRID